MKTIPKVGQVAPRRLAKISLFRKPSGTMSMLTLVGLLLAFALTQNVFARKTDLITAFLYPPFYGHSSEVAIFDHSNPTYSTSDDKIVTYMGETLTKNCAKPAPEGHQPPNGYCDRGYGGYWSYQLGAYTFYNGHDGIDFGASYRPVLAAADSNEVVYAGWYNPQDHRSNLGIYVRLRHSNGYESWYGHLSATALQSCTYINCANIQHGDIIGTSGNTGNSSGPNLHFRVTNTQSIAVDPYGWAGQAGQDPWPHNQKESLWVQYPNTSGSFSNVYPSGGSLLQPNTATNGASASQSGYLVDDLDPLLEQIPAICWNAIRTDRGSASGKNTQSQNGRLLAIQPIVGGEDTCKVRWKLPPGADPGMYGIYVRIPAIHATSEGAIYSILHDGHNETAILNQAVFPNSSSPNGWVYLGKYYFNSASLEYIQLGNKTMDVSATAAGLELAADAVRFVLINLGTSDPIAPVNTPTATNTLTATITKTPSINWTASITPSLTITGTETFTKTPTATKIDGTTTSRKTFTTTPTWTKTPTITRTMTLTPVQTLTKTPTTSATFTPAPTMTRTPTITRTMTLTPVQTPTKTPTTSATFTPAPTQTKTPTLTATRGKTPSRATFTPSATATGAYTSTPGIEQSSKPLPSATLPIMQIKVFFANKTRLALKEPPYEVIRNRFVLSNSNLPQAVLALYFHGPDLNEQKYYGDMSIYDGFRGYSKFELSDGLAHVYLMGSCKHMQFPISIAQMLYTNLKQFPEIKAVKIYDENGQTEYPDSEGDSPPTCLNPLSIPTGSSTP